MKKVYSIIILIGMSLLLSGCQLATTSENLGIQQDLDEEHFIPYAITFKGGYIESFKEAADLSEYIYFSYICDDMGLSQDYTCGNYGKSLSGPMSLNISLNTVNDVLESSTTEYSVDGTVYYGPAFIGTIVYPTILLTNEEETEVIEEHIYGMSIQGYSSAQQTMSASGKYSSGEIIIMSLTITYEFIGDLQSIEFKEYDKDDKFIKSTLITRDSDIERIDLSDEASYFMVVENYLDIDGNEFQKRTLMNEPAYGDNVFFHLKFLNDLGLAENDHVFIYFKEE